MIHRLKKLLAVLLLVGWVANPAHAVIQRTIVVDPIADDDRNSGCTLREAVEVANAQIPEKSLQKTLGCVVTESGDGLGLLAQYTLVMPAMRYTLSTDDESDPLVGGPLMIQTEITIVGEGPEASIIDAGGSERVFETIRAASVLILRDLQITGGRATRAGGAGIRNVRSVVELDNAWVLDNHAEGIPGAPRASGGGVENLEGELRVLNGSRIVGNSGSGFGGGVFSDSSVVIADSTIDGNQALQGGGFYLTDGRLTAENCEITGNRADQQGGGLSAFHLVEVYLLGCRISSNETGGGGGGIVRLSGNPVTGEPMDIANTIITDNAASGGAGIAGSNVLLSFVTVVGNRSEHGSAGVSGFGQGITLHATLVADNVSTGYVSECGGELLTEGANLMRRNPGCLETFPAGRTNSNGDFVGTEAIPLPASFPPGVDLVQLPEPGLTSLARDAIASPDCVFRARPGNPLVAAGQQVLNDQRGLPREGACDIGAVESTRLFQGGFEGPAPLELPSEL